MQVFHNSGGSTGSLDVCLSPACVQAANSIIVNMSPRFQDIDPCVDFESFVCEGFNQDHDMRADQSSIMTTTVMSENSQRVLRLVLETPYSAKGHDFEVSSSDKAEIFDKLKSFYDSCMDEDQIKAQGAMPLISALRILDKLFKDGVEGSSQETLASAQKGLHFEEENPLTQTIGYLELIGVTALVEFGVGVGIKAISSFENF